ncbi:hypothetical protein [Egicoccus halophilus]|uniref:hypothetical protein n=1 Tax=Egicoccus halophilus TaxID=1670830 RepID=UPI0010315AB2|nr:hypothetical protein [Egicoccus halophilus]
MDLKSDTDRVKREFDDLSNSTQVFIWCLVGLGVIVGLLLGGAVGYGVAVEEVEGRDCIEHDDELYCANDGAGTTDDAAGETG